MVRESLAHLRVVLRAHDLQRVEQLLRRVQLILELHLALDELPDLVLNLADFLDHHLTQQLLTQLRDRQHRAGALAALVGGGLVRSVVALVAHAIIIASWSMPSTPSTDETGNICCIS